MNGNRAGQMRRVHLGISRKFGTKVFGKFKVWRDNFLEKTSGMSKEERARMLDKLESIYLKNK